MNCTNFDSAMEHAVELRQPINPAALEHASTCETCRRTWELQQRLNIAIEAWLTTLPSAGLADAVLERLKEPAESDDADCRELIAMLEETPLSRDTRGTGQSMPLKSNFRRATRSTGLALISPIACLFLIVVFASFFSAKKSTQPFDDMVDASLNHGGKLAVVESTPDVSATITDVLTDLRLQYDEVASETKSAAIEVVNSIPSRAVASGRSDSDDTDLNSADETTRPTWHPISSRVKVAMGFLWRAVPSNGQSD